MLPRIGFLVAASTAFVLPPVIEPLGPLPSSLISVALGLSLAWTASRSGSSLAAGAGALGAFLHGVAFGSSPALAGGALVCFCYGERTVRVSGTGRRCLHIALALAGGLLAGHLAGRYGVAPWPLQAVVAVLCGVLAALPRLVTAEDPVTHALALAARDLGHPARAALQAAVALRQVVDESALPGRTARELSATWHSLVELAQARVRLEHPGVQAGGSTRPLEGLPGEFPGLEVTRATIAQLDRKIQEHAEALARAHAAAEAVVAAELSLDEAALDATKCTGESLELFGSTLLQDQEGR